MIVYLNIKDDRDVVYTYIYIYELNHLIRVLNRQFFQLSEIILGSASRTQKKTYSLQIIQQIQACSYITHIFLHQPHISSISMIFLHESHLHPIFFHFSSGSSGTLPHISTPGSSRTRGWGVTRRCRPGCRCRCRSGPTTGNLGGNRWKIYGYLVQVSGKI